jgi:hypothetical protein
MDQPPDRVTPNWPLLAVIVASAIALGVLPFLVWFGAAPWAIAAFAVAVIWVPWKGRRFVCTATERPRPMEWLLAGWSVVGYGAISGLMGFVWYLVGYGAWSLVVSGARALGWMLEVSPATIAGYTAGAFVVMLMFGTLALATDELPARLYPEIAGTRSVFFPLTARPWTLAAVAGAVAAAFASGLAVLDWQGLWFALGATLTLAVSAAHLMTLEAPGRPASARAADARQAIGALFAAAGYNVVEKPRTGRPEVDPLIASLDFLAVSGSRGFAIEAKVPAAAETAIEWSAASTVRTAAKTLQRALRAGEMPEVTIEPFLIVVGGSVSDDLLAFAEEEGVKLARFPGIEPLRSALAPKGDDYPIQELASRVLQVPAGVAVARPASVAAGTAQ